jgi:hypothetical protein
MKAWSAYLPTDVRTMRLSDRQWRIYLAVWLVALAAVGFNSNDN